MSRTHAHHVPLEQAESASIPGGALGRRVRRRAALEEELAVAFGAGDRERVSELRPTLAALAEDEESPVA